jgi:carbohydrate-selective porin OprB
MRAPLVPGGTARQHAFFIQPEFQYIIQPGGTSRLNKAPVFASQFGINF